MPRAYTKSGSIEKYEGGMTVTISTSSVTKPTITPDTNGNYSWPSISNYTYNSNATSGDFYLTTNYQGKTCIAYYKKNINVTSVTISFKMSTTSGTHGSRGCFYYTCSVIGDESTLGPFRFDITYRSIINSNIQTKTITPSIQFRNTDIMNPLSSYFNIIMDGIFPISGTAIYTGSENYVNYNTNFTW